MQKLCQRGATGTLVLLLCIPRITDAQSAPHAVPGRAVTTWQGTRTDGFAVRVIYARNDTTAPIVITKVQLSKCTNLRIACDAFVPDAQVMAPGATSEVATVLPANIFKKFSFTSVVEWRTATECLAPRPPGTAGSPVGKTMLSTSQTMIVPPLQKPSRLKELQADVKFFVADNGRVDSVDVGGIADEKYLGTFRSVMMRYTFRPALDRGCPVPGTVSLRLSF